MYWYNPVTRTSERVEAPSDDTQAIEMLAGTPDSVEFVKEYCELRRSGTPIAQALVLVGHEFRLRQPEYQLILR
ncbi:MAG TPA: hypothetical protein VKA20_02400 [Rubrobacter sp.]|jgi:hypothetical protein|nr:hypothetical protein [Rubrobacter sp.]